MLAELREEVCALHAELPRNGLVAWTSGNLSARVPGESLMVVGHEPDFTRTIFQLTGAQTKLSKAGVALVQLDPGSMKGELRWLVPPKFAKE